MNRKRIKRFELAGSSKSKHIGVYLSTNIGSVHALISPDADKETVDAVKKMAEIAYNTL